MKRLAGLVSLLAASVLPLQSAFAQEKVEKVDVNALLEKKVFKGGDGKELKYRLLKPDNYDPKKSYPLVVFLHEGLGSVAMWKDFPAAFCAAHDLRGFVFSRYGYGRSTPKPPGERWPVDFMAEQANVVLPALFDTVGINRPWLFGHSDGATIALLHAATHPVAGVVAVAPHLFVEDLSIASIERARVGYESGVLREGLARHHADPDSAFRGWNDAWLAPEFRA